MAALLPLCSVDTPALPCSAGVGTGAGPDRAAAAAARVLEEAWAWGFDVSAWRAHLSALTWPEVRSCALVLAEAC